MARVTLFHTSDMHNKLDAASARRLRDLKQGVAGSLMLDSGDAIWAGNIFWRPGGEPVLELMNNVPYDALCMGNREYHFLGVGAASKTSKAAFPVVSANLRPAREGLTTRVVPCLRVDRDGVRIMITGVTVPCITERMLVKKISDFYFEQPVAAAGELIPRLRGECDLLIALTHIGIKQDRDLAEKVPGIDLILGGHTHTITAQPERVGNTWILHHGCFARFVGRVDIDVDAGGVSVANELIPLAKA